MEETSPNSIPQPHHFPQPQQHHQQQQQQQLQQQFQQQQQRLLQQQQLFLMQQQQQHYQQQQQQQQQLLQQQQGQQQQLLQQQQGQQQQLQQQQNQQQQQQLQRQFNLQQQQAAMSRFPSNIDAHLRAPGLRSLQFQASQHLPPPPPPPPTSSPSPSPSSSSSKQQPQHLQPSQSQQLQLQGKAIGVGRAAPPMPAVNPAEVEMAQQDALKVCNPDVKRPFTSVEDAVLRLLPYHVVSDYEAEEDDRILDSDSTGRVQSRLQQWDHNILTKIAEFTNTFEKQVLAFNIMTRKRACGEFRSEERLMIEQALMQEERQALLEVRAEVETREKANREAAETKMRMAMVQAEHARAEAQSHPEMIIRPPIRSNAAASHGDDGSHDLGQEQGNNMEEIQGWGNAQRDDEEPSEDFLNDENENENGDAGMQDEWRESGELDLNTR